MKALGYINKNTQGNRVYGTDGIGATLSATTGGLGGSGVSLIYGGDNGMKVYNNDYLNGNKTENKKFKYASLFSGIGGFETALNALGGECVFASEIDKFARQSYEALYGHVPSGDITKIDAEDIPDHDLLVGGFPCFVAGTKVLTSVGYKPIEDIESGELVLTHKNRWKRVVTPMAKVTDKVYRLKANGTIETKVTAEHPYYVSEREDVWNNELRRYERTFSEPKWVDVKDLDVDKHYLSYAVATVEENPLEITEQEAYIIGRYIADGYTNTAKRSGRDNSFNNKVILCIGKNKALKFSEKITDYHFGMYEDKTVIKATASSDRLVKLCSKVGSGAKNKQIPTEYLNLPTELLSILLDGYLSGDGSYDGVVHSATTISEDLALSLAYAIRKVYGVQACITFTERPKTTEIEGRTVNQNDTYRVQFRKQPQKTKSTMIDSVIYSPINSIELINEKHTVFNIEVEDDNSYTANGVTVHNCQAFSLAGKRGGFDDTRGTLIYDVVRIASVKQPSVLLLENVKGLISHSKGQTLDTIVKIINDAGYRVDFQVLNSKYYGVPQNRERIFLVCIREDLIENESWNIVGTNVVAKGKKRISSYDDVKTFNFDYPTNDTVEFRLRDFLEEAVDEKYYLDNDKVAKLVAQLSDKDIVADKPNKIAGLYGNAQAGSMYDKDGISPTLDTAMGGNREPIIDVTTEVVGEMAGGSWDKRYQHVRRVFGQDGVSPTLTAGMGTGGGVTPKVEVENGKITNLDEITEVKEFAPSVNDEGVSRAITTRTSSQYTPKDIAKSKASLVEVITNEDGNTEVGIPIQEATKKGYALATEYDSVNITYPSSRTHRGRVGKGHAHTLVASGINQGVVINPLKDKTDYGWHFEQGVYDDDGVTRAVKADSGSGNIPKTIETYRIRKLTPKECWRLQGFTDAQHDVVENAGVSNSQRYKQAGNAVTVNVVYAIAQRLLPYIIRHQTDETS